MLFSTFTEIAVVSGIFLSYFDSTLRNIKTFCQRQLLLICDAAKVKRQQGRYNNGIEKKLVKSTIILVILNNVVYVKCWLDILYR